jgi:hypothetical protein
MLTELCNTCRNWFTSREDKHVGHFTIEGGVISPLDFVLENQYFRIVGSHFNDGVYKNTPEELDALIPEEFDGQIWAMRIPPAFLALNDEIDNFNKKITNEAIGPYASESWGGYSYTLATGSSGGVITWQEAFAPKLKEWRKL